MLQAIRQGQLACAGHRDGLLDDAKARAAQLNDDLRVEVSAKAVLFERQPLDRVARVEPVARIEVTERRAEDRALDASERTVAEGFAAMWRRLRRKNRVCSARFESCQELGQSLRRISTIAAKYGHEVMTALERVLEPSDASAASTEISFASKY